jgi:hypothetical protein
MSSVRYGSNRIGLTIRLPLPIYPDERTSSGRPGMSQTCQKTEVADLKFYHSDAALVTSLADDACPKTFSSLETIWPMLQSMLRVDDPAVFGLSGPHMNR